MPREGVTYDQIAAVAERISADGKIPTLRNVRAIHGTGSMATIRVHLRKWKDARTAAPIPRHDVGSVVLDAMRQEIETRAKELSATLEADARELREELEAISAESEQRAARVDELEADLAERERLLGRMQELESELTRAREDLAAARADAEAARREAAIAAVSMERLPETEAKLEATRQELRDVEQRGATELLEARTRAARAEGELAGARRA